MKRLGLGLLLASAVAPLASGQGAPLDATRILDAARIAMSAANLRTIEFSGSGFIYTHGQALSRFGPLPRFDLKSFDYVADYVTPGSRVTRVRVQGNNPPRGGGPQPVVGEDSTTTSLNGDLSWGNGIGGAARLTGASSLDLDVVEQRQVELWETPHGFLAAAAKSPAASVREQRVGGRRLRVISIPRGKTHMDGYIDDENLVERVETWIAHPVLGDMSMEMRFADYRDWNGVKFPARITEAWGGEVVLDVTVGSVTANAPVDLTVPDTARRTPPEPRVVTTKLADGIYNLGGANANTIAIEFKDFIMAIEAGMGQERSVAVIPEIRRLFPTKPLRYLVNTHAQYLDHAGGVRPYAAEGATIITHKDNKKWFEQVALAGTWTIKPDELARRQKRPPVEAVDERKVYTDGSREVVLYHVAGNMHDAAMLMAYLPDLKWIIEADAYSTTDNGAPLFAPAQPPPNAPPDFPRCCDARNFYDNVRRLKLEVTTIVPIHGVPASWTSFLAFLGAGAEAARP